MPSFSSPSPPIATHLIHDPRPTPSAQAPLSSSPSIHKTSQVLVQAEPTSTTRIDSRSKPGVEKPVGNSVPGECIDQDVFEQILELDDEDDKSFSKGMVDAYYEQAEKTFEGMDDALAKKDLTALSDLGHFLKGSSAALGVSRVQSSCEDIQYYGKLREGAAAITEAEAIVKITKTLARAREEYAEAKIWLDDFYEDE
ncbi:signal transduction histidine kinase [Lactifluus subvellereus]|nr:signal transduction histidine kinase [Lactifluus subvellereus]